MYITYILLIFSSFDSQVMVFALSFIYVIEHSHKYAHVGVSVWLALCMLVGTYSCACSVLSKYVRMHACMHVLSLDIDDKNDNGHEDGDYHYR